MPKYLVDIVRTLQPIYGYATVEVEAGDEDEAREFAIDKAIEHDVWEEGDYQDYEYEYEVDDIVEVKK